MEALSHVLVYLMRCVCVCMYVCICIQGIILMLVYPMKCRECAYVQRSMHACRAVYVYVCMYVCKASAHYQYIYTYIYIYIQTHSLPLSSLLKTHTHKYTCMHSYLHALFLAVDAKVPPKISHVLLSGECPSWVSVQRQ